MLDSAPSGLEAPDKIERLPKKPKGKTNSKEKLNHEAAYPTALSLCQTTAPNQQVSVLTEESGQRE
jgi:hypothetical protein